MSNHVIKLAAVSGKTITQTIELQPGVAGAPASLEAVANGKFVLIDESTGLAPRQVAVKRVGQDLHIGLEGASADQPQVVIENYYGSGSQLVGEAEGGQYYEYAVSSNANSGAALSSLAEDAGASVELSQSSLLPGFADTMAVAPGAGALGLGTLGAIGAAFAVPVAVLAGGLVDSARGKDSAVDDRPTEHPQTKAGPAAPLLTGVYDDEGPQLKAIPDGGYTEDITPVFKGQGHTPGDSIEIRNGSELLGRTTVDAEGNWSLSLDDALVGGTYTFSIVEVDPLGHASDPTQFTMTVDTSPPSRPLIDRVVDDVDPHVGIVNRNEATNDTRPTIEGRGKIGSIVYVYDNGGSEAIGSVKIGESGTWSFRVPDELSEGSHGFTAQAQDHLGRKSSMSKPYTVDVDTTPPGQPTILQVVDHVGSIQGALENHAVSDDPKPVLSGQAEAGSIVAIYDGDTRIGSVVADSSGAWAFTPRAPLPEGEHVLTVSAEDEAGNVSVPSEPFVLEVDVTPPPPPVIVEVIDKVGTETGPLNPHDITDDAQPELKGTAEAGSLVLIYDTVFGKQVLLGSVVADADGNWAFQPSSPLPEGDHRLTMIARDAAGNESEVSDGFDFTLQVGGVPVAASITGVFDALEPHVGNVEKFGVTNDSQPTVIGTAAAGSIVQVFMDGRNVASTTADELGRWTYRPEAPLADGSHMFAVSAPAPNGGGTSQTGEYPIVVDTTPPAASMNEVLMDGVGDVTGPIANGATTDDASPIYTGRAEAGAIVTIHDGGKVIGSTVAGEDGNWTFRFPQALADGPHSLSTTVTDRAGNSSAHGEAHEFTVDTSQLAITIDQVVDHVGVSQGALQSGQPTDDRQPEVMGKARANSLVKVYVDGEVAGSAQADANGNWSLKLPDALSEGKHAITASSTTDGTESEQTKPFTLNVDVTPPAQPAIESVQDDVGAVQTPVENHGVTDDTTPTLKGTAEANALVTIHDGGTAIGSTFADNNGHWSFTPPVSLSDGEHGFTATARDAAGNESVASDIYAVNIDTSGPGRVVITGALDDQAPQTGSVPDGGDTNDTSPTLQGTAKPGSTVTILDNGAVLGSTTTDASGNWSFTPDRQHLLSEGRHVLTAHAKDLSGAKSELSGPYELNVDTTAPGKPSITEVHDQAGEETGLLKPNDVTDDAQPVLKGQAESNSLVMVYDTVFGRQVLLGSARADADGNWTFRPASPLPEGEHALQVLARDAAGNESEPSDGFGFVLQVGSVPGVPAITGVFDGVEPQVGNIAPGGVTNDPRPTVNGTAKAGEIVHLYLDGQALGTAIAGENGRWSYRPDSPLSEGEHAFHAIAEDANGGKSPETGRYVIEVDVTAPAASTSETLMDGVGDVTGPIANGATTDDAAPIYTGRAEAGAIVTIHDGGKVIGSTVAGEDGNWTFRFPQALADGPHSLSTTVTDRAGNSSAHGEAHEFTVDTSQLAITINQVIDHVGVSQGALQSGQPTDDQQPEVMGKARANSLVKVYVDGEVAGSTQADANGNWSLKLPDALSEGEHAITASSTTDGTESGQTKPFMLNVDITPPGQPAIESAYDDVGSSKGPIENHGATDDTTPTLKGTAEANALVMIHDGGVTIGSTFADSHGQWSFTPAVALRDGDHSFTVTARDMAGNESQASAPFELRIDTSLVELTVITDVIDTQEPQTGSVSNGGDTNDTRPTLHGTAVPGSTVTIFDNGERLGTTVADSFGNWRFTPDQDHPLSEGEHALTAQSKDAQGAEGEVSEPYLVKVDTTAPEAPSIVDVIDDVGTVTGSIARDETTDDTRPTLKGTAEPGSIVFVEDRINGATAFVGSALADADGNWTLRPDTPLKNGDHQFEAMAQDAAGNESVASEVYGITVMQGVPSAPAITGVTDAVEPKIGHVEPNGATNDAQPTVNGTAVPGQIVHVSIDGKEVGTAIATSTGQWSYRPTAPLPDGEHAFSARAEGADGQLSESTGPYPVQIDTVAPSVSLNEVLFDDVGVLHGPIANGTTTDDATPAYSGRAEIGAIVSIYDGVKLIGSTIVKADGSWQFRVSEPLADGAHSLSTTVTDRAGNVSGHGKPINFTVDTSKVPIAIDQVVDHVGEVQGALQPGQTTDDRQPEIRGKAGANAIVKVLVDQQVVGSVQADEKGHWSLTLPNPLAEGDHRITATATTNGVVSPPTAPFDLTVDITAPDRPSIDAVRDDVGAVQGLIANGGATDDATPSLSGRTEAGALVTISDGGQPIGSTLADTNGNWSFTPGRSLADGEHRFTVTARDPAGNLSEPSEAFVMLLDTSAPRQPSIAEVIDAVGDVTGPLQQGETTDDAQPLVKGLAERDSVVLIYDTVMGTKLLIGSARADADGNWSFRPQAPYAPLVDGDHHLSAVATDEAGNRSEPSDGFDFTVLVGGVPTAPAISGVFDAVAPHVGHVEQSGVTNDTRPTVMGTAPAGQLVHVRLDGKEIGTVQADANGRWSFRPETPLSDGEHRYTAVAEVSNGKLSDETGAYTIVVDTTPPAVATDLSLIDGVGTATGPIVAGGVTDDATPTYRGKAEPGAIVTIYDGDQAIGSTLVQSDGTWHFRLTEPLADGAHSLSTTVTDPAGNTSERSESIAFTVESGKVDISIDQVIDHAGAITGVLQPGQATDDTQPEIKGKATPDSLVKVYVDGELAGSATTDADGRWSWRPEAALAEGHHSITATSTGASGESDATKPFDIVVDITPPSPPTIESVADDVGPNQAPVPDGGYTDDTTPSLAGQAEAGAIVTIRDGDTVLGSTVSDANGRWSFTPAARLGDGEHVFTATAQDAAGNVSEAGSAYRVHVSTAAPGEAHITQVMDSVGPIVGDIHEIGVTDDTIPMFTGTADAGSVVMLYAEFEGTSTLLGSTRVSENGDWSLVPTDDLDDGVYRITMVLTDRAGNVGAPSAPYLLEIDTVAPAMPTITDVIENVGGESGSIGQQGGITTDHRPQIVGSAESGALVTITSEHLGVLGSTYADASGQWRFTPDKALDDGLHVFSVMATDAAGNPSARSGKVTITIEPESSASPDAVDSAATADALFGGEHDLASHVGGSDSQQSANAAPHADEAPREMPHEDGVAAVQARVSGQAENAVPSAEPHGEPEAGNAWALDLSKLSGNEAHAAGGAIGLDASAGSSLKLSLDDVLQHGGKDLFMDDGRTQLMVKGGAHDTVDLSGTSGGDGDAWVEHGATTVDGVAYTVYENSAQNAELLVQHGVTTHLM
ncbi:Ig-like domain-containing protein [Burkholderia gladioli]|uniref:Ig-like domain-containing protein n=1 Tax=Burkholderia gladioli TaxID=28095 RepID=UPI001641EE31|nr:Ig-like domain-containing protein [Burkholderia gladioli]